MGLRQTRGWAGALLGSLLLAAATPAVARQDTNLARCSSLEFRADDRIAACTAMIGSGRFDQRNLAILYMHRGDAYSITRDYVRAIQDYDQAISRNAGLPDPYIGRGYARLKTRDYVQAIRDYDEAARLAPDSYGAHSGRCWARAVANTDLTTALAACDRALVLSPGRNYYWAVFDSRALVRFRMGDFTRARADYDLLVRDYPKRLPFSLFMRGVVRRRMGDLSGGDADIAAAKASNPGVAEYHAYIGVKP
jgi:tetratricopeptide (TPR) repeat protein